MSTAPLDEVARWDLPLLRGAVWTLDAVADRLPAWRARMETVARALTDTDCWYGPAAEAAGTALVGVSTVATEVTGALDASRESAQRLLGHAEDAQELAARALAAAAAVPVVLDGSGRLVGPLPATGAPGLEVDETAAALRSQQLAEDALQAASRALLCADEAAGALVRLGAGDGAGPVTFADLAGWVHGGLTTTAVLPPPGGIAEHAAWWAGLSMAERATAIAQSPARIGQLDGLPAWARDQANRTVLDRTLADPSAPGHAVASSVAAETARREASGHQVHLYQFQPEDGLVALALGDVDTADAVSVLVPGTGTDPAGDVDDLVHDADAVAGATRAAAPGLAVAAIAWLGYRPPSNLAKAVSPHHSWAGGRALDATLDGLAAARTAAGRERVQTTVIGHSYGTMVIDRAADAPGRLAADDVVLLGSPGMDNRATDLEVDEVHEASAPFDPVTGGWDVLGRLGFHGWATDDLQFGAEELPTDWRNWHVGYYDEDGPTLPAVGEVAAGLR